MPTIPAVVPDLGFGYLTDARYLATVPRPKPVNPPLPNVARVAREPASLGNTQNTNEHLRTTARPNVTRFWRRLGSGEAVARALGLQVRTL